MSHDLQANSLILQNIVKKYRVGSSEVKALQGVSLTIQPGDMFAIVGPSGSGKSTLMNIIGLLDTPDEGSYHICGKMTQSIHEDERALLRNQYIGFVFQQFNLLPRLTVAQNIALPLTYRGMKGSDLRPLVDDVLRQVNMHDYCAHRPTQLSGGQQQRVAIARALVSDPQILLADEPTGSLDSKTGESIMALFQQLNQKGRTIVIVTHDAKVASLCRNQLILIDGRVDKESNHDNSV